MKHGTLFLLLMLLASFSKSSEVTICEKEYNLYQIKFLEYNMTRTFSADLIGVDMPYERVTNIRYWGIKSKTIQKANVIRFATFSARIYNYCHWAYKDIHFQVNLTSGIISIGWQHERFLEEQRKEEACNTHQTF